MASIDIISKDLWDTVTKSQGLTWREIKEKELSRQARYYVSDMKGIYNRKALDVVEVIGDKVRIISTESICKGYIRFSYKNRYGKSKRFSLHNIRAKAYKPKASSDMNIVRHLDGNKLNNELSNLEWGTQEQNGADYAASNKGKGHNCPNAKFSKLQVRLIYVMADIYGANNDTAKLMGLNRNTLQSIAKRTSYQNAITDEFCIESKNFKRLFFLKILNQFNITVEDIFCCPETSKFLDAPKND